MRVQHLLDLAGVDVVAAADDQLLLAVDEEQIAVVVDVAQVARSSSQPSASIAARGRLRVVPVARGSPTGRGTAPRRRPGRRARGCASRSRRAASRPSRASAAGRRCTSSRCRSAPSGRSPRRPRRRTSARSRARPRPARRRRRRARSAPAAARRRSAPPGRARCTSSGRRAGSSSRSRHRRQRLRRARSARRRRRRRPRAASTTMPVDCPSTCENGAAPRTTSSGVNAIASAAFRAAARMPPCVRIAPFGRAGRPGREEDDGRVVGRAPRPRAAAAPVRGAPRRRTAPGSTLASRSSTSGGASRMLSGTTIAPSRSAPKYAATNAGEFGS